MAIEEVKQELFKLEGNTNEGYVSTENSGVTVAKGFDIGQHSVADLKKLGLPQTTINKLAPYTGLKKDAARQKLASNPLTITDAERDFINERVFANEVAKAKSNYENNVGFSWEALPENVQDALVMQSFQLGEGLYKNKDGSTTNFTGQMAEGAITGDYTAAADNLSTWNVKSSKGLQKRYKAAADLLGGRIQTKDVHNRAQNYLEAMRNGDISSRFKFSDNFTDTMADIATDRELMSALGDARASQVASDMKRAETVGNPHYNASYMFDDIGNAIDQVRGFFGGAPDPKPFKQYEVKAGDTLYDLSKALNTSVDQLMQDNNITDPKKLQIGQILDY